MPASDIFCQIQRILCIRISSEYSKLRYYYTQRQIKVNPDKYPEDKQHLVDIIIGRKAFTMKKQN